MITAKDFKKKISAAQKEAAARSVNVADLVEEKLSKILPNGNAKNSFSIDYDYMIDTRAILDAINFCNCVVKELKNRGFINVDYGFSKHTVDFYFDVDLFETEVVEDVQESQGQNTDQGL